MPKFTDYFLQKDCKIKDIDEVEFYAIKKIYYSKQFLEIYDKNVEIIVGDIISEGSFGYVHNCLINRDEYVIKKIKLFKGDFIKYTKKDFINEIKLQNKVSKYNLSNEVLLAYFLENKKECGFIMKKYSETLLDFLKKDSINIETKKLFLNKVRKILECLVIDIKICHGDLHLENIMIDENNELKLIDFGNSNTLKKEPTKKLLDSDVFYLTFRNINDINEDILIELEEYWEEVIDGFTDYIVDY